MTDKVTIYEVAARAGVSISTVSLVLNSPTRVRQATRERVLTAADELGFVPKADAVTRARKGVGRIGVIAPFSSYPSFSRRLAGVFAAIGAEALEVVVFDQQSAASASSPLLASLPITRRLDGLIIMGLPLEDAVVERLRAQRLPTVVLDSPRPRFEAVVTDDEAGGELVARYLAERGHRRFGYVGEAQRSHAYVSPSESRLAGFRRVVDGGLPDEAVRLVRHDVGQARAATHELLDLADPPTAIFAHDDTLAGGVLAAARDRGLAVPGDLAVVGFDDSDLAQALDLTTVRQPFEESGRLALRALLDQMQGSPTGRRTTVLDLELVVRATA
ncbi:LacI family DNA-binding transcriptional regulator [Phytohabitans sp. ZYX-F-186]|uniref:LacI family DNA-binding transcriptional regulator n=1 Tax=Phytohabitans maris TaxID=3071409 RepID=A0ABU0ZQE7_9ACTN|nr:LacI family DNA-binding transcriptional regulator [Phytohabitans sp. ZYX-F-186]MDQ7908137.1 LacI family DNA-binding transcriptional regulator [Phytohabitans sp. ZYX-F-186]